MQCAECGVRSAVGYCGECETLLCEVCGRTCSQCGKVACRSHLQRTSSGRNICVSCVVLHYDKRARQSKERRERRAEEAALGGKTRKHHKHAAEPENLSFEALARDLTPPPRPVFAPEVREEEAGTPVFDSKQAEDPFAHSPLYDKEALNARVLTGSASSRTPPWLSGLALGVVSWVLCLAARSSALDVQQFIYSGIALLLSLGTVAWTAPGAFAREEAPGRTRCRAALVIGVGAVVFAGLLLARKWL